MQFRALLAIASSLSSGLFAGLARAEEPAPSPQAAPLHTPAPPDERPPSGAKVSLIITGAVTTTLAYGLGLGASYLAPEEDFRGSKQLRIPIAGPWLALARTGCPTSTPDCSKVPLVIGAILEVMDGVVQAGGLGIIAEGFLLNTSSGARPSAGSWQSRARYASAPRLRAVPMSFDSSSVGLGVAGTF